jgi:hypothetical protein
MMSDDRYTLAAKREILGPDFARNLNLFVPAETLSRIAKRADELKRADQGPNIEVLLTDETEFHCFQIILRAGRPPGSEERVPGLEIFLHTTQAIDLFSKLAEKLAEYMHRESAVLLKLKAELAETKR